MNLSTTVRILVLNSSTARSRWRGLYSNTNVCKFVCFVTSHLAHRHKQTSTPVTRALQTNIILVILATMKQPVYSLIIATKPLLSYFVLLDCKWRSWVHKGTSLVESNAVDYDFGIFLVLVRLCIFLQTTLDLGCFYLSVSCALLLHAVVLALGISRGAFLLWNKLHIPTEWGPAAVTCNGCMLCKDILISSQGK